MEISNLTSYLQQLTRLDATTGATYSSGSHKTQSAPSMPTQGVDMYIPSGETGSEVLTSDNYSDLKQRMSQMIPPLWQPMDATLTTGSKSENTTDAVSNLSSATTQSTTDTSDSTDIAAGSVLSILQKISNTMHVRPDSIVQTMNDLGMKVTDLYDSDQMKSLVDALNQGALDRGLPTGSSDAATTLSNYVADNVANSESTNSISDSDFKALLDKLQELLYGTTTSTSDSGTSNSGSSDSGASDSTDYTTTASL